jgi:probable FeS assembly SUF system protein SufT
MTLAAGTPVVITQSLGGTTHGHHDHGRWWIAAQDVDARHRERRGWRLAPAPRGRGPRALVWDQLRNCYDPEIPVNIVDLGLVYHCAITPLPEGGNKAEVKMTLTAPACPVAGSLPPEVETKVRTVPGVTDAKVDLVWDPPWSPNLMSEAAKLQLGIF